MDYIPYLDIQFQFVDHSYNLTVKNLYKYHEINRIPVLYDGFIEQMATDYFNSAGLEIDEISQDLSMLEIAGI